MRKFRQIQNQEQGFVSIIVTLIMMIILTLIVIGFAQTSRREERQALDRQLSTQAFYAAESGINSAAKTIQTLLAAGNPIPAKTKCGPETPDAVPDDGTLDHTYTTSNILDPPDGLIQFTCLLVDPNPKSLQYTIPIGDSQIAALPAKDGNIDAITINWQNTDQTDTSFNCSDADMVTIGKFLPQGGSSANVWPCSLAVLRLEIVPGGSLTGYAALQNATTTVFLYPQSGGLGSNGPVGISNGQVIGVNCNPTPPSCNISLTVGAQTSFYLRLTSIYKGSIVSITPTRSGNPVSIVGSEVVIDATGKANDVLRRIRVFKDISGLNSCSKTPVPCYAIQTFSSICKQFSAGPGFAETTNPDDEGCKLTNP